MEKNYHLKVNEHSLYFKSLESVKKWFIECGVEKRLKLEDDEEFIELEEIGSLLGEGEVEIYNECMIERGDDYCVIELEEISWED
jgi:hypothetical protein